MAPTLYTSANLTYLPQATVLRESLDASNPDLDLVLILVDEPPVDEATVDLLAEFDEVILARDLFDEGFDRWIFGHDVVEACTAVKGRALQVLLERGDVIYLDPDLAVFGSLDEFAAEVARSSVHLTTHLLEPVRADSIHLGDELSTLRYGIYNFGMYGVSATEEGRAFADWWSERLRDHCIDDVENGLFTDQRWADLVPSFFPSATISRDPGVNVASWNIHQRSFAIGEAGEYLVNGRTLVTYHFTKAETIGLKVAMLKMEDNPLVADLWRWYLERLESWSAIVPPRRWAYSRLADGSDITRDQRREVRSRWAESDLPDPFTLSADSPWWRGPR